jgi:hypothetical protein
MRNTLLAAPVLCAALFLPITAAPEALAAADNSPSPVVITTPRLDTTSARFSSTEHRVTIGGDLYLFDDDDPFEHEDGRWTSYEGAWPRFHMKRMPRVGAVHKFLNAESRCLDREVRGEVHAAATLAANGWLTISGVINVFEGSSCGDEIEGSTPFTFEFEPTLDDREQVRSARTDANDESYATVTFKVQNELP